MCFTTKRMELWLRRVLVRHPPTTSTCYRYLIVTWLSNLCLGRICCFISWNNLLTRQFRNVAVNTISSVEFSQTGEFLATGDVSGRVSVYKAANPGQTGSASRVTPPPHCPTLIVSTAPINLPPTLEKAKLQL